ncbi:MAG: hypothetical protein COA88_06400 [Kordia sp.]|nr:MAG: hypothetical protein COA88_06400 [Kordia sp.]
MNKKNMKSKTTQLLILLTIVLQSCSKTNYLENSILLYGESDDKSLVRFNFKEQLNNLGHLAEPWATNTYNGKGSFWVDKNTFQKQDSLINSRGSVYVSKTDITNNMLLYLDYGDKELLPVTEELYIEKLINTARYTPITLLYHFKNNKKNIEFSSTDKQVIYTLNIDEYPIQLFINKSNNLVDKITYLSDDELYGDITTSFMYSSYIKSEFYIYPAHIKIEKINGKVIDIVEILTSTIDNQVKLLEKPKEKEVTKIKTIKYNDYIHFIDLEHTNDRVMVVELDDYILVAEAPINSKNGELIISEVKKIAPSKPIKYFVFGHHHPHYLGGLRAFVHKEATILCTDISKNYVEYIAEAPHTLTPDSLQLEKKKLKTQVITDSLVLGTNKKMEIYFIGNKSAHTKDYLIYYFPSDKLLFQDDLCWIPNEGAITKAGNRQLGLYNAIIELNLNVETIIQSWPVKNHKVKTVIPFTDLEKSILIEK